MTGYGDTAALKEESKRGGILLFYSPDRRRAGRVASFSRFKWIADMKFGRAELHVSAFQSETLDLALPAAAPMARELA